MPVTIHPKGTPLPLDHPFKVTMIHLGIKRPKIDQHEGDKLPLKETLPNGEGEEPR